MTIKQFYLETYPTDDQLFGDMDVYDYIGVADSLVRERLFSELAKQLKTSYDYVYNLWFKT